MDADWSEDNKVWEDFTMSDYESACTSCEVSVIVTTVDMLRRIRSSLFYDRRDKGARGRALRWAIPGTPLQPGDRLEPNTNFRDTGLIDRLSIDDLPVRLIFWRSAQVRVKHRNPLFNRRTGVTPFLLAPDQLHALNLGALQRFSQELVWIMMRSSVWVSRQGLDQKSWVERCCIALRADLNGWETKFNRQHPLHKPTTVQKITPAHLGTPNRRLLKLKAAEMMFF